MLLSNWKDHLPTASLYPQLLESLPWTSPHLKFDSQRAFTALPSVQASHSLLSQYVSKSDTASPHPWSTLPSPSTLPHTAPSASVGSSSQAERFIPNCIESLLKSTYRNSISSCLYVSHRNSPNTSHGKQLGNRCNRTARFVPYKFRISSQPQETSFTQHSLTLLTRSHHPRFTLLP